MTEETLAYLPLLNLLVVPVFVSYLNIQLRLKELEIHKCRVELRLGFDRRDNGK